MSPARNSNQSLMPVSPRLDRRAIPPSPQPGRRLAGVAAPQTGGCYVGLPDASFSQTLLQGLSQLYADETLCDYRLIAENQSFFVHKVLFAAVSDYFTAVFRSGMREASTGELQLRGVSAVGLRSIVEFVYSGRLQINHENSMDVLMAASHLQMPAALNLVSKYFKHNLSLENIREMQNIAESYHLVDLQNATRDFVLDNFSKYARTKYFKELPLSEVCSLIKDSYLKCHSEFRLFRLLMEWIYHSSDTRHCLASNILKHVRLAYMSPEELKYIRKLSFVESNRACTELLDKAIYFREHPKEQILLMSQANEVRSEPFVVTFGCSDRAMHACILYKGTWYPLDRALSQPRPFIGAAMAVLNNFLFVCGGQSTDATNSCLCFNPCWGKWLPLAPMNKSRRNFGLVAYNMHLYAIGGITEDGGVTDSVEEYSIRNNSWRIIKSMPVSLADVATCSSGSKLYVAAGVDHHCIHVRDFRAYDTTTSKWHSLRPTLEIKFRPVMYASKGYLYLIDLYRTEGSSAQLERYSTRSKQWTNIQLHGLKFSRTFGAALLNQWVYFVGRNDVEDGHSKRYNVTSGHLESIRSYPWEVEGPMTCVIRLPHRLLQRKMLQEYKANNNAA